MKAFILSAVIAPVLIIFVFINSYAVGYNIDKLTEGLENAPSNCESKEIYEELYKEYQKREKYIALSISHSDLLSIEDSFAEILGAIEARDEETLIIEKSRVIKALNHIKRLSGINFDSIF